MLSNLVSRYLAASATDCGSGGCGTAFKLSPKGETLLHTFTGAPDGGLVKAKDDLYGVTYNGGTGLAPVATVFVLHA